MFILHFIAKLLYGSDYEKHLKKPNVKRRRK